LAASINFQHHFFLFLSCLENGNIELGVHIADVAHFVKPGSLTDQEAKSRSTTVYLADLVLQNELRLLCGLLTQCFHFLDNLKIKRNDVENLY
jgi:hypothetical protein